MECTETMTPNVTAASAPRRDITGAYIDWAAIFGGAVVAAAIGGLFTAFGAALGLSTISAEPGEGSFNLWLGVTALWLVILLVTAWMWASAISGATSTVRTAATAAGSAVGGMVQCTGNAVGGEVQGVAQAVGAAVPDDVDDGLMDYINSALMRPEVGAMRQGVQQADGTNSPGTPSMDDAELTRQSGVVLGNVLRSGNISEDDRAFLVSVVARRTGQSEAEVEARVDQAVTAVQGARENAEAAVAEARADAERLAKEAEEAAIAAAETARKSAILTAFLLTAAALVAGAAAVSDAVRGGRHRDEGRIWGGFSYRF